MIRGGLVIEVAAGELENARRAVGRAISTGALGSGYAVSLEGDAVIFDGGLQAFGASRGRIAIRSDGSASFELHAVAAECARVAQAALLAALASVTSTLVFNWIPTWALPLGGVVGTVWTVLSIGLDRRRLRRSVRVLLRGLPLLIVDS